MIILAIETSCDETSIALIEATGGLRNPRFKILKNVVSSQIKVHRPFGGVVPMLAKREHLKNLPVVLRQIFGKFKTQNPKSKINSKSQLLNYPITQLPIDLIAVTVGPGLEPALWPGIEFAKQVTSDMRQATGKKIELVGANHLEGHLYSFLANPKPYTLVASGLFPAIALLVSGGHTILLKMDSLAKYKKLGETRDDAAGEAFDKVAKMMGLPYPGGPEIERLAKKGKATSIKFPRPMIDQKNYEFSFSGLKTAVLYHLRDSDKRPAYRTGRQATSDKFKADVAASFQEAVIDVLTKKTLRAAREFGARSVILAGGVAMNKALQKNLSLVANRLSLNFFVPPKQLLTDNAAMIGIAAYINFLRRKTHRLTAQGNLSL